MIEDPGTTRRPLRLVECGIEIGVRVKANRTVLPLDGVKMKIIGEILAGGKAEERGDVACAACRARAMQRAVNRARFFANVLHDVDFAALGPTDGTNVIPKHRESGPHSLPRWNFDARFETSIDLAEQILRLQASGRVIARDAVFGIGVRVFLRGYDEVAALELRVLRAIGIGLEFVVPPAVTTEVVCPFCGIRRGTIRPADLMAPDEGVARGRRRLERSASAAAERRKRQNEKKRDADETKYEESHLVRHFFSPSVPDCHSSAESSEIKRALEGALFAVNFLLELKDSVEQRLWPRRTTGHVK